VLEFALDTRRGNFHLQLECRLASEWTVIFGPSGAGKSTLLRLLAGLDRFQSSTHHSARLALDGNLLTNSETSLWLPPGHRKTTMVAQQPSLFPHLSVAANVAYGLTSLNPKERRAWVEEMLHFVGANELANRRPQHLSGGEAQRVALARALAPKPRLLLLDEPFSALDGAASDALLSRLQDWAQQHHIQTVMATHDATDALASQAQVALLHEGRLAALGPVAEVLATERQRLLDKLL